MTTRGEDPGDKPLVWLHGEISTPPLSLPARIEAGRLLRSLQRGERLSMPHARAMRSVGRRCIELRVLGGTRTWRIVCRVDRDAVVILAVFPKTTRATPTAVIKVCKQRLRRYDAAGGHGSGR